jgi:hypothetical protein
MFFSWTLNGGGTVFSLPPLLEQAFSLTPGYYRTQLCLTGGNWRFRKNTG